MKRMKQFITSAMVILLLCMMVLPAAATEMWSEAYYRITDYTGELTSEEIESLEENCINMVSEYHLDAAGLVIHTSEYEDITLEEISDYVYESCGYGYGPNKDGFLVAFDSETNEVCISLYGSAKELMTERYVESLESAAFDQIEEYGAWGVIIRPIIMVSGDLQTLIQKGEYYVDTAETGGTVETDTTVQQTDSPRVVDDADIFTDAEESAMLEKIGKIQDTHQKDIVIYTTNDAHGKRHEAVATDFYEAGNYGFGTQHEGIIMTIVMDPDDRGFMSAARGPETRSLYKQSRVEFMDDCLFEYVKDRYDEKNNALPGEYGAGILNWLDQVDSLFTCGRPIAPFWMTDQNSGLEEPHHDDAAPRVTCEQGMMTDAEIQDLTERCKALSDLLGIDIAINAAPSTYWLGMEEYAARFYRSQGYGFNDTYDGMMLFIALSTEEPTIYDTELYLSGTTLEKLTVVNYDRMGEHTDTKLNFSDSPYETALKWLSDMEHMEKTGRVMPLTIYWVSMAALGIFIAGIAAVILLIRDEEKQKKPRIKKSAVEYTVPNTLQIVKTADLYRTVRIVKTYDPVKKSSDDSSGGSSNYTSNYTSSSGNSYTTSGRSF